MRAGRPRRGSELETREAPLGIDPRDPTDLERAAAGAEPHAGHTHAWPARHRRPRAAMRPWPSTSGGRPRRRVWGAWHDPRPWSEAASAPPDGCRGTARTPSTAGTPTSARMSPRAPRTGASAARHLAAPGRSPPPPQPSCPLASRHDPQQPALEARLDGHDLGQVHDVEDTPDVRGACDRRDRATLPPRQPQMLPANTLTSLESMKRAPCGRQRDHTRHLPHSWSRARVRDEAPRRSRAPPRRADHLDVALGRGHVDLEQPGRWFGHCRLTIPTSRARTRAR